jgi:hypothetical protein
LLPVQMTKKSAKLVIAVRSSTLMSAAFLDSAARTAISQVGCEASGASGVGVSVLVRECVLLSVSYYREGGAYSRSARLQGMSREIVPTRLVERVFFYYNSYWY